MYNQPDQNNLYGERVHYTGDDPDAIRFIYTDSTLTRQYHLNQVNVAFISDTNFIKYSEWWSPNFEDEYTNFSFDLHFNCDSTYSNSDRYINFRTIDREDSVATTVQINVSGLYYASREIADCQ